MQGAPLLRHFPCASVHTPGVRARSLRLVKRMAPVLSALLRAALALSAMLVTTPVPAADDAAQRKDLASVIALEGRPCGEVVTYEQMGRNDFVAACRDGNRYRVSVSAEESVVVQKQSG